MELKTKLVRSSLLQLILLLKKIIYITENIRLFLVNDLQTPLPQKEQTIKDFKIETALFEGEGGSLQIVNQERAENIYLLYSKENSTRKGKLKQQKKTVAYCNNFSYSNNFAYQRYCKLLIACGKKFCSVTKPNRSFGPIGCLHLLVASERFFYSVFIHS